MNDERRISKDASLSSLAMGFFILPLSVSIIIFTAHIMKKYLILFILLVSGLNIAVKAESAGEVIRISTDKTDLIYRQAPNGRLYQSIWDLS